MTNDQKKSPVCAGKMKAHTGKNEWQIDDYAFFCGLPFLYSLEKV